MPANLPPQYSKVEDEYRRAATAAERLEKARELFRLLPKHKGTEKLQSELKQRISRLKDEIDHAKSGKKAGPSHRVPREGAGQVVLVGPPNAGKSALLKALTHAQPEVAPYPFTTHSPQPGMMRWQDVQIQLVDLPAITDDYFEPWVSNVVRAADAAWLVVDLSDDGLVEAAESTVARLARAHVELVHTLPFDVEDEAVCHLRTLVVANKADAPDAELRLEFLGDWAAGRWPLIPVSAATAQGLDTLTEQTYRLLEILRVYTKAPGKPADKTHPFTLDVGGTVLDLARLVHRDLEHSLKFARVWGSGVFDGQTVGRDHILQDADVVELHV
jgi:ribosome-interacting GTPase 1